MRAFLKKHSVSILDGYFEANEKSRVPLDRFINSYLIKHKSIGPKHRVFVSNDAFSVLRNLTLLKHLAGENASNEQLFDLSKRENLRQHRKNKSLAPQIRFSIDRTLLLKIESSLGKEAAYQVLETSCERAPLTIRVNPSLISRSALIKKFMLDYRFSVKKTRRAKHGVSFISHPFTNLYQIDEFKKGYFEVQDEGAQIICEKVSVTEGMKILDFCAGSGGKSLPLVHQMNNKGLLLLHDVRENSIHKAKARMARANASNVMFSVGHKRLKPYKGKMDLVMADVPCSGTGTFRRNPDMKYDFSENYFKGLLVKQGDILEECAKFVRPGGELLYITCSVLEEENFGQVKRFLTKYKEFEMGERETLLPVNEENDGFFYCFLKKKN